MRGRTLAQVVPEPEVRALEVRWMYPSRVPMKAILALLGATAMALTCDPVEALARCQLVALFCVRQR